MTQIPDAPYIREAEISGYPVGEDDSFPDPGDCPALRL